MKIKKILFTSMFTSLLTLPLISIEAGLSIINNSNISQIQVKCSGPMPGVPITKGQTITLQWPIIKMILGGYAGSCAFFNGAAHEADASIALSPDLSTATITSFYAIDPKLQVNFTPAVGTPTTQMTATVTGG